MFSIVIPLHNKEQHIGSTIESALAQSFSKFELIVINDASTDNSVSIVESYDDNRIRLQTIAHAGVSEARNTGIRLATYDWIVFLDADDWWSPTYLEILSQTIHEYPDQKVFATAQEMHGPTSTTKRYVNIPDEAVGVIEIDYICHMARHGGPYQTSCVCVSRELLHDVGLFRKGLSRYEDVDLWLRLGVEAPVIFIDSCLSHYRETEPDTLSKKRWDPQEAAIYLERVQALEEKILAFREKECLTLLYNRMLRAVGIHQFPQYSSDEISMIMTTVKEHYAMNYYIQMLLYKFVANIFALTTVKSLYKATTFQLRGLKRIMSSAQ